MRRPPSWTVRRTFATRGSAAASAPTCGGGARSRATRGPSGARATYAKNGARLYHRTVVP